MGYEWIDSSVEVSLVRLASVCEVSTITPPLTPAMIWRRFTTTQLATVSTSRGAGAWGRRSFSLSNSRVGVQPARCGELVGVDQGHGQRQVEDRPQLAVNRVLVGQLGEMPGETVGELLVERVALAGVDALALGGEQLVFAQHAGAVADELVGVACGGGADCGVTQREPPAEDGHRGRGRPGSLGSLSCFYRVEVAFDAWHSIFEAHADEFHVDVGLDQHAGDAAGGVDAEDVDVLPAERLAEVLEPGVTAARFESAGRRSC